MPAALAPDFLFVDGQFRSNAAVIVGDDGAIEAVVDAADVDEVQRLSGRAIVPGFVNAHSHAFQRAIRGRTQARHPGRPDDDFWTWRAAMYGAASRFSPEDIADVSRWAFVEMALAGYTTVGEFHYLHCGPDGAPYDDPNLLSLLVTAAARAAGLRICLLRVVYLRGGPGEPARPLQRRFVEAGIEQAISHTDALTNAIRSAGDSLATVGIAPHSVRAVTARDIAIASEWARSRGQPLHIHVAEQPAEVRACLAETGHRPVDLLFEVGALGRHVTAVHATHLSLGEIGRLGGSGTRVCVCPTTEADLGDGILQAGDLVAAGVRLCLGSDSQAMIDPFAEMRALEHHERLRVGRRNALVQPPFGLEVAPLLLDAASEGGAGALGLSTGTIAPGRPADLVAIDLDHPTLAGADASSLAATLALHGSAGLVTDVWVQGRAVVTARHHPLAEAARAAFERVIMLHL